MTTSIEPLKKTELTFSIKVPLGSFQVMSLSTCSLAGIKVQYLLLLRSE